jgi:general secretion pathway protein M
MRQWWNTRSLREQRLLLAMGAIAAIVLVWLLIIRPIGDSLSDTKARHAAAVVALAEVRADADALQSARQATPVALGGPVDSIISQSATAAGFPTTQVTREGANQATIAIDAVRPQAFFGWVDQMEASGLTVERLSASTNTDQTLSVRVTFRGGAS